MKKEKKKISLSYRKTDDDPWKLSVQKYSVGDIVKCKVLRMLPFGAFLKLEEGIDGLVHISQIANFRINRISDVLKIGQEIEAKITYIDIPLKKISLSIKDVNSIEPFDKNETTNNGNNR